MRSGPAGNCRSWRLKSGRNNAVKSWRLRPGGTHCCLELVVDVQQENSAVGSWLLAVSWQLRSSHQKLVAVAVWWGTMPSGAGGGGPVGNTAV